MIDNLIPVNIFSVKETNKKSYIVAHWLFIALSIAAFVCLIFSTVMLDLPLMAVSTTFLISNLLSTHFAKKISIKGTYKKAVHQLYGVQQKMGRATGNDGLITLHQKKCDELRAKIAEVKRAGEELVEKSRQQAAKNRADAEKQTNEGQSVGPQFKQLGETIQKCTEEVKKDREAQEKVSHIRKEMLEMLNKSAPLKDNIEFLTSQLLEAEASIAKKEALNKQLAQENVFFKQNVELLTRMAAELKEVREKIDSQRSKLKEETAAFEKALQILKR